MNHDYFVNGLKPTHGRKNFSSNFFIAKQYKDLFSLTAVIKINKGVNLSM